MKLRTACIVAVLTLVACGSSSSDNETAAACSKACSQSAAVCGLEKAPPQCPKLCEILGRYTSAQFDCVNNATSCDDAQRCMVNLDSGSYGLGRIGQRDPSGCAPYLCLCADGKMDACGSVGDSKSACEDPTEAICRPNCEKHGGLVRIAPTTNLLCGTSL